MTIQDLPADDKLEFCSHVREAIFHLASCWDALRQAESMIEGDIETKSISEITSNIDDPEDAFAIDDKEIEEALAGVLEESEGEGGQ